MPNSRETVQPIINVEKNLKSGNLLPVYFLSGEDSYGLSNTVKQIEKIVEPLLTSEFDQEIFYAENKQLNEVLDFASAFPFGSEKKLIIYKEFEKVRDKKNLASYINSPADFTILVIVQNSKVTAFKTEPYKSLIANNFIFEAKELKGNQLFNWLIIEAENNGKKLSSENAQLMVDMVGENRNLLETQLDKLFAFLQDKKEISFEDIKNVTSALKQYTVFDLTNAIAKKDKTKSLKVANELLKQGEEPGLIIHMLTRYFSGLSRVPELIKKSDGEAARIIKTHPYFYNRDYKQARRIYSEKEIFNAADALLKADVTLKTTSADSKTIVSVLISEILQKQ